MRARITLAFVSLLAGLSCSGPISDWPPSAEQPDDGPGAMPGGKRDAAVGEDDEDAGLPGDVLDAGPSGGAPGDAAASSDAGQSIPPCGDAASDAASDALAPDAADAALPDVGFDADGAARPAPPAPDAELPDAALAADADASADAADADGAAPLTAPCL